MIHFLRGNNTMPIKKQFIAVFALLCLSATVPNPARAELQRKDIRDFLGMIHISVSAQKYYPAKDIEPYTYDFERDSASIGGNNGTRIYYNKTNSSLTKSISYSSFTAEVETEETGFVVGMRFGDYKDHEFSFGKSRKDIRLAPYTKVIYQGACNPCLQKIGKADLSSESYFFDYVYELRDTWDIGMGYETEELRLHTAAGSKITTDILSLNSSKSWNKFRFDFEMSKYETDRASIENLGIETRFSYRFTRGATFFFDAGMYTDGMPLATGAFSDIGDEFVFSYLTENDFGILFNERFGYFSLGLEYTY